MIKHWKAYETSMENQLVSIIFDPRITHEVDIAHYPYAFLVRVHPQETSQHDSLPTIHHHFANRLHQKEIVCVGCVMTSGVWDFVFYAHHNEPPVFKEWVQQCLPTSYVYEILEIKEHELWSVYFQVLQPKSD